MKARNLQRPEEGETRVRLALGFGLQWRDGESLMDAGEVPEADFEKAYAAFLKETAQVSAKLAKTSKEMKDDEMGQFAFEHWLLLDRLTQCLDHALGLIIQYAHLPDEVHTAWNNIDMATMALKQARDAFDLRFHMGQRVSAGDLFNWHQWDMKRVKRVRFSPRGG